jgi:hypothetical protein
MKDMGFLSVLSGRRGALAGQKRRRHKRRMNLGDVLLGRRIVLRSPLPTEEVARRINAATGSIFNPVASGVSGWTCVGILSLHWSVPLLNGYQKYLVGRMVNEDGATSIRARFGVHPLAKVFLLFWYGLLLLFSLILASAFHSQGPQTGNEGFDLLILAVLAGTPLMVLYFFGRDADRELEAILDMLADAAQAVVIIDCRR